MAERGIEVAWLELTINEPALIRPDPDDVLLEHRYRPVPEFGGRVLRVIINTSVAPVRIVSAFFDRSMRGKL